MTHFLISYSENLCLEKNSYLRNFNCSEKSLSWGKFIPQRMYLLWSSIALKKIYTSENVFILRLYCLKRVSYLRKCKYSKSFVRLVNSVQWLLSSIKSFFPTSSRDAKSVIVFKKSSSSQIFRSLNSRLTDKEYDAF